MFKSCQNNVLTFFFNKIYMINIFKFIILILFTTGLGQASEVKVFDFTEKELSELDVRKVRGSDN